MNNDETPNSDKTPASNPLTDEERRAFLARAAKLAAVAPAATLLLEASNRSADAQSLYGARPSDRRLKTDVVRVDTLPNGLPLYSFRYVGGAQRFIGVMADDVELVIPGAVSVDAAGYKQVDYSQLLG